MQDHKNTIAGWVLFAGIIALGATIVTGEVFHAERPEKMGYPIEGVVLEGEGGAADKPMDFSVADAAKGEQVFKKCAACHKLDGNNAVGPHLDAVVGRPVASVEGFSYSDGMHAHGGDWTPEALFAFLANPKKVVSGTKMSFAGLPKPEDRANVIAYLEQHGG